LAACTEAVDGGGAVTSVGTGATLTAVAADVVFIAGGALPAMGGGAAIGVAAVSRPTPNPKAKRTNARPTRIAIGLDSRRPTGDATGLCTAEPSGKGSAEGTRTLETESTTGAADTG
jgi:hypothetical protein